MAGRDISVTHGALGTVRVMRTGGCMGEIVGMAAAICRLHHSDPRDVYESHLEELQELMREGVGKPPEALVQLQPPEWLETVGDNLARTATVRASGVTAEDRNLPSRINDGRADLAENEGRWLSQAEVPNWVELSWDQPQTITAVRVISGFTRGDGSVYAPLELFSVQAGDGETWRDIAGTGAEPNTAIDWHQRFEPVVTKHLRLFVRQTQVNVSRVWEVEVYGPRN
jgi:hypothetical protein